MSEIDALRAEVARLRAREEWLARHLATHVQACDYEPLCPIPGYHKCEFRPGPGYSLCQATDGERAECWRKAADMATARHIAASSPDVVRADLEEILALRAEVARLKDEIASLEQELKFSDETEYELIKKLFDLKICHKEVICEQAESHELNFEGESGCLFCWRQWAIRKARKAEREE